MSGVRLYMDEDAREEAVVKGVVARGIDVLTTADAQQLGATDVEQLATATRLGRVIYTFYVGDFARLHRDILDRGLEHSGIVVIPDQRHATGEKIRRIAGFVQSVTAEDMVSRMEFL